MVRRAITLVTSAVRFVFLAVAFIALASLLVVTADSSASAMKAGDWFGVITSTIIFGLFVFVMYGFWLFSREKLEASSYSTNELGWYGKPISALIKGPILHTYEGLILLLGSAASVIFALVAWLAPSIVERDHAHLSVSPLMFALWPFALMVLYVRICRPHFESRAHTIALMVVLSVAPFYAAYK